MKKWTINKLEFLKNNFKEYIDTNVFSRLDSLTGAYSQAVFFRDYKKEDLYRLNYYIDLDNFKKVNEKLGPIKASRCLSSYVNQLKKQLKNHCYKLYRLGGDEFILSTCEPVDSKVFTKALVFEKLQISSTAVSLNFGFHDKISLEKELSRGQLGVKRSKRVKRINQRNIKYDLSVG